MGIFDQKWYTQEDINKMNKVKNSGQKRKQGRRRKKIVSKKKYREYIFSKEWKAKREQIKYSRDDKCALCSRPAVTVHHRNYRYIQTEKEEQDLTPLCVSCHNLFHKHYKYNNKKHIFEPK